MGGLVLILSFLFFLWVPTYKNSSSYFLFRQIIFWMIVGLLGSLTYLGGCHPEYPYLFICQIFRLLMITLMFLFKLL